MKAEKLSIDGAWRFEADQYPDERGNFVIWYESDEFASQTGYELPLAKTHHAVSAEQTIRGIHFTLLPPGQAKYVYCPAGRVLDVVVDVRVGSPTFGQWDSVVLDQDAFSSVFVADGLGHAYAALTDDSVLVYLCSTRYAPEREVAVDALDPAIGIEWPEWDRPILSQRDREAPSLAAAADKGLLPSYEDCVRRYEELTRPRV